MVKFYLKVNFFKNINRTIAIHWRRIFMKTLFFLKKTDSTNFVCVVIKVSVKFSLMINLIKVFFNTNPSLIFFSLDKSFNKIAWKKLVNF